MHGPALAVGHAALAAEELADDALDGATAEDGEGMAAIAGDDAVGGGDSVFEAYRDGFLSDSQMTEPANHLGLVQRVGGHLHPPRDLHLLVHRQELVLGHFNLKVGHGALVGAEGVLVQLDGEGLVGV